MRSSVEEALAEHGLSWHQYALLLVLCEVPGLSHQGLAERAAIDRTCASRTLAGLEERELVTRSADVDRRRKLVYATEAGKDLIALVSRSIEAAERTALLPLDPRERARLSALLAKVIPPDRTGVWALWPEWNP